MRLYKQIIHIVCCTILVEYIYVCMTCNIVDGGFELIVPPSDPMYIYIGNIYIHINTYTHLQYIYI